MDTIDDKLTQSLGSLPRESARPGFTAGVLRRLEGPRRPPVRRLVRQPWLVATAALLLLAVAFGAREAWHLRQRQVALAQLEQLESERQALEAELRSLRRRVAEARPEVYLGGDNRLDLILDLEQLGRQNRPAAGGFGDRGPVGEIRPARGAPRFADPRFEDPPPRPTVF
jgi:hypothetical protein